MWPGELYPAWVSDQNAVATTLPGKLTLVNTAQLLL